MSFAPPGIVTFSFVFFIVIVYVSPDAVTVVSTPSFPGIIIFCFGNASDP